MSQPRSEDLQVGDRVARGLMDVADFVLSNMERDELEVLAAFYPDPHSLLELLADTIGPRRVPASRSRRTNISLSQPVHEGRRPRVGRLGSRPGGGNRGPAHGTARVRGNPAGTQGPAQRLAAVGDRADPMESVSESTSRFDKSSWTVWSSDAVQRGVATRFGRGRQLNAARDEVTDVDAARIL
jgi:hypothetical protein